MLPKITPKKTIYLDHAATTPVDPEVKAAMEPFFNDKFGNPSSLYKKGREANDAVEKSRAVVADLIGARPSEIIFTAGGTESVNLAIFGVARLHKKTHLITSATEHHCVINSFAALAGEGYKTTLVRVDKEGFVNLDQLKKSVRLETVLISIMYANNEIGTIAPIAEIGRWLKAENNRRIKNNLQRIIFHTDACQAAGFLDLDVNRLGVDLMSVNGSKIYGPKQTGFLYVRSGVKLKPLIYGGGQENGLRSGTQNVTGIVGLAKALELASKKKQKENLRLFKLSGRLISEISKQIPDAILNGPTLNQGDKNRGRDFYLPLFRLPNNVNFSFKNTEGESLMFYLDSYGINSSTASACSTGQLDPSHVLLAIGHSKKLAKSSIRFTLGKSTQKRDIDYLLKILPALVRGLRKTKQIDLI